MRTFIDANSGQAPEVNADDFFDFSKECFFDECDKLRDEFSKELTKAGVGCSKCRRNSIYRKYKYLVGQALKKV